MTAALATMIVQQTAIGSIIDVQTVTNGGGQINKRMRGSTSRLETSIDIQYVGMNIGDIKMTSKRGQLKDIDAREQHIRDNAVCYSVTLYKSGTSGRPPAPHFDTLDEAKTFAFNNLTQHHNYRSAMIYAINEHERSAMCGSMDKTGKWKEVVPKRHK